MPILTVIAGPNGSGKRRIPVFKSGLFMSLETILSIVSDALRKGYLRAVTMFLMKMFADGTSAASLMLPKHCVLRIKALYMTTPGRGTKKFWKFATVS